MIYLRRPLLVCYFLWDILSILNDGLDSMPFGDEDYFDDSILPFDVVGLLDRVTL